MQSTLSAGNRRRISYVSFCVALDWLKFGKKIFRLSFSKLAQSKGNSQIDSQLHTLSASFPGPFSAEERMKKPWERGWLFVLLTHIMVFVKHSQFGLHIQEVICLPFPGMLTFVCGFTWLLIPPTLQRSGSKEKRFRKGGRSENEPWINFVSSVVAFVICYCLIVWYWKQLLLWLYFF